jgi:hypothetical protein
MSKSKKVPKYEGPNADKMDDAFDAISVVIEKFRATLADGVQVKDYLTWYCLARESYDIAKQLFPDGFKQDEVIHIARYIYWAIDPNWPLLPEFIERKLEEKLICDMVIPLIVHNAWDAVAGYVAARKAEAEKKKAGDENPWCKNCSLREFCPCPPFLKPLCPLRIC